MNLAVSCVNHTFTIPEQKLKSHLALLTELTILQYNAAVIVRAQKRH